MGYAGFFNTFFAISVVAVGNVFCD